MQIELVRIKSQFNYTILNDRCLEASGFNLEQIKTTPFLLTATDLWVSAGAKYLTVLHLVQQKDHTHYKSSESIN